MGVPSSSGNTTCGRSWLVEVSSRSKRPAAVIEMIALKPMSKSLNAHGPEAELFVKLDRLNVRLVQVW